MSSETKTETVPETPENKQQQPVDDTELKKFQESLEATSEWTVQAIRGVYMSVLLARGPTALNTVTQNEVLYLLSKYCNYCYHAYNQKNDDYIVRTIDEGMAKHHFKASKCLFVFLAHRTRLLLEDVHDTIVGQDCWKKPRMNGDLARTLLTVIIQKKNDTLTAQFVQMWHDQHVQGISTACDGCVPDYKPDEDLVILKETSQ